MNIRSFLTFLAGLNLGLALAQVPTLIISTNSTPMDRQALEQVSREAFRRIGVDFKLVRQPSERSLNSANLGEVDGEGVRVGGLSTRYPNLIQVPESYGQTSLVAFSTDPNVDLSGGWYALKPYSVAFITGWKTFESNAAGARLVTKVDTPEQLFRMLGGGRIDLALYTKADGVVLARRLGLPKIVPLSPSLIDVDGYLYLNKKHQALVPKVAQALRSMKADGSYGRIMAALNDQ